MADCFPILLTSGPLHLFIVLSFCLHTLLPPQPSLIISYIDSWPILRVIVLRARNCVGEAQSKFSWSVAQSQNPGLGVIGCIWGWYVVCYESGGCWGCGRCVGVVRGRSGTSWTRYNSEILCYGGRGTATRINEMYQDLKNGNRTKKWLQEVKCARKMQ